MQDITIRTISGRLVSLVDPQPATIDIGDIAHSLALQCRFIGHLPSHYSVAQHSCFVSEIIDDPLLQLAGLMHDAAEAYTGDLTAPMKALLRRAGSYAFDDCETRLWLAICAKFGIQARDLLAVKPYDLIARATEDRDLRGLRAVDGIHPKPHARTIVALPANAAERLFLQRFEELFRYHQSQRAMKENTLSPETTRN